MSTCEHLIKLERALLEAGVKETFRSRAWSQNSREWAYFDCFLPTQLIREKFDLADCVKEHDHMGTHDGQELGFVCSIHQDGIMGHHPNSGVAAKNFYPK